MDDARRLLRDGQRRLTDAGIGNAGAEARWLWASVMGVDGGAMVARTTPTDEQATRFEALVARRCQRQPLQHLLGRAAFRHLDLHVGPGVFVPRPETELLVDLVLGYLAPIANPVVVDLCSGSGAIGLAVACEAPQSRVTLLERSGAALDWLRRNVADQPAPVRRRIHVVQADVTTTSSRVALADQMGKVDVVVVNPPYVPTSTVVGPEVEHDPPEAVFAGVDGLDLFPSLSELALALLHSGGRLALEHDESHPDALSAYLAAQGWLELTEVADLTGRPRFITALRG